MSLLIRGTVILKGGGGGGGGGQEGKGKKWEENDEERGEKGVRKEIGRVEEEEKWEEKVRICMPPRIISCCEFCDAMRAGGHARGVSQNGLKEVTQFHSR